MSNYPISKVLMLLFASIILLSSYSQTLNPFQMEDIENEWRSYESLKGEKLTLIDFWATWCKPCQKAIPELIKIQTDYKEKGVNVVGVSVDSPRSIAKVRPMSLALRVNYPILLDSNSDLFREMNVSVLPTLIIVDAKNRIVFFHEGYSPGDELKIRAKIEALILK